MTTDDEQQAKAQALASLRLALADTSHYLWVVVQRANQAAQTADQAGMPELAGYLRSMADGIYNENRRLTDYATAKLAERAGAESGGQS